MLLYVFHYLVSSLLIFQGTHLFAEIFAPMGVVPSEVSMERSKAQFWGFGLFGTGALGVATGLVSHVVPALEVLVMPWLILSLLAMAAYGTFVLFFHRKVEYLGKATENPPRH